MVSCQKQKKYFVLFIGCLSQMFFFLDNFAFGLRICVFHSHFCYYSPVFVPPYIAFSFILRFKRDLKLFDWTKQILCILNVLSVYINTNEFFPKKPCWQNLLTNNFCLMIFFGEKKREKRFAVIKLL
ncbi:hypothetical protein BY458DRAFT_500805, partial [Sporodiniella umbellata]